ncbi:transposase [Bradyrhizobium vignae]|uniref:Transposase n=1 Tax=Bradyrhizobium vignae TaxID=1549949 RepID=A0A2U3Q9S3_9BRAD|nr:transposase [Bradyrhizobium vignae]
MRKGEKERQDARTAESGARGKAQRNFTDPNSRILKTKDGYIQGYNAQVVVDGTAQIIVAHGLTARMCDHSQLVGLIDGIEANLGFTPKEASADSGYLSEANLQTLADRHISAYVAIGRAKHAAEGKRTMTGELTKAMRAKLKRAGWRSRYRLRNQIVKPVFGQIKQAHGFRQFLLRGTEKVTAEWALICTTHNLRKLARAA